MVNAVETRGLGKVYQLDVLKGRKRVVALDGLDLTIPAGHVLGVLGPNGAGKSTTIKLLLNLIRPTSGSALIFGRPPSEAEARRDVGYLPENPAPYEYLSGAEFVTLAAQLSGLKGAECRRRVDEVLGQVQMTSFAGVQIRRYSKGMTQRIALAQALVARPRLLILDEPTSGLDVLGRQLIREIVLSEKQRGTSILLCSHIIPDVEALSEDVAILVGGKLVRAGPVSELLSQQDAEAELVFEGLSHETLDGLRARVLQTGRRVVLRCPAAAAQDVILRCLGQKATLISMQPIRLTLEDTFLEALKAQGQKVGSVIE
ncbi:MAG: ABC transporter ATP-binding protein [Myxococcaceae bacterium]|nr:ABC transporter ATP-binding protein [Myxococcaceae bacterium]